MAPWTSPGALAPASRRIAWEDDFAAARNASLSRARGAFVLVLDADERLAASAAQAIRAALARDDFDCGLLPLHNAARLDATPDEVIRGAARRGEPNFLPRLLRRTPDLRFEGIVHESILGWLKARGSRIRFVDAPIVHLGGVEEVRQRLHKAERNIALLEKASAAAPEDPAPLGYLAHEYFESGRRYDARAAVERGWALIERGSPKPGMSVLRLAAARARDQLERGDAEGVLATVDRAGAESRASTPISPSFEASRTRTRGSPRTIQLIGHAASRPRSRRTARQSDSAAIGMRRRS